jgi:hypothetical protein
MLLLLQQVLVSLLVILENLVKKVKPARKGQMVMLETLEKKVITVIKEKPAIKGQMVMLETPEKKVMDVTCVSRECYPPFYFLTRVTDGSVVNGTKDRKSVFNIYHSWCRNSYSACSNKNNGDI